MPAQALHAVGLLSDNPVTHSTDPDCSAIVRANAIVPETSFLGPQQEQSQGKQQVKLHLDCQGPCDVVAASIGQLIIPEQKVCKCFPTPADLCIKCGTSIKRGTPAHHDTQSQMVNKCLCSTWFANCPIFL